jgi:hypothetical protein
VFRILTTTEAWSVCGKTGEAKPIMRVKASKANTIFTRSLPFLGAFELLAQTFARSAELGKS